MADKYLNERQTTRLWAKIKARFVSKSGDTMTGALTLSGAPTSNLHASTKKYVDDSVSDIMAEDVGAFPEKGAYPLKSAVATDGIGYVKASSEVIALGNAGVNALPTGDIIAGDLCKKPFRDGKRYTLTYWYADYYGDGKPVTVTSTCYEEDDSLFIDFVDQTISGNTIQFSYYPQDDQNTIIKSSVSFEHNTYLFFRIDLAGEETVVVPPLNAEGYNPYNANIAFEYEPETENPFLDNYLYRVTINGTEYYAEYAGKYLIEDDGAYINCDSIRMTIGETVWRMYYYDSNYSFTMFVEEGRPNIAEFELFNIKIDRLNAYERLEPDGVSKVGVDYIPDSISRPVLEAVDDGGIGYNVNETLILEQATESGTDTYNIPLSNLRSTVTAGVTYLCSYGQSQIYCTAVDDDGAVVLDYDGLFTFTLTVVTSGASQGAELFINPHSDDAGSVFRVEHAGKIPLLPPTFFDFIAVQSRSTQTVVLNQKDLPRQLWDGNVPSHFDENSTYYEVLVNGQSMAYTFDEGSMIIKNDGTTNLIIGKSAAGEVIPHTRYTVRFRNTLPASWSNGITLEVKIVHTAYHTEQKTIDSSFIPDALLKSGGTMTGALTLSGAPTSDLHAATKKYVDDAVGDIETLLASIYGGELNEYCKRNFKTADCKGEPEDTDRGKGCNCSERNKNRRLPVTR